jgi:hypothetical protein
MSDTRKIYRRIRIYDESIWQKIEELEESGTFRSFNDIINRALAIGIPELYERTFNFEEYYGEEMSKTNDDVQHTLNKILALLNEATLNDNMTHWLLSSLFNAECRRADDVTVSSDMLKDGSLSSLPDMLEKIQNNYLKSRKK